MQPNDPGCCPSQLVHTLDCPPFCWSWALQMRQYRKILSITVAHARKLGAESVFSIREEGGLEFSHHIFELDNQIVTLKWSVLLPVTYALVDIVESPPEGACRETAKADIGTQDSCAGTQCIRRCLWLLKIAHPCLQLAKPIHILELHVLFCATSMHLLQCSTLHSDECI